MMQELARPQAAQLVSSDSRQALRALMKSPLLAESGRSGEEGGADRW